MRVIGLILLAFACISQAVRRQNSNAVIGNEGTVYASGKVNQTDMELADMVEQLRKELFDTKAELAELKGASGKHVEEEAELEESEDEDEMEEDSERDAEEDGEEDTEEDGELDAEEEEDGGEMMPKFTWAATHKDPLMLLAVGGYDKLRGHRANLVDKSFQESAQSSKLAKIPNAALGGSPYADGKFIPDWIQTVYTSTSGPGATPIAPANVPLLGKKDLLLVIGHIKFLFRGPPGHHKEWTPFLDRQVKNGLPVKNVWVQGGGPADFNIKACLDVGKHKSRIAGPVADPSNPSPNWPSPNARCFMGLEHCPEIDAAKFQPLLAKYPQTLRALQAFQVGGFLATVKGTFKTGTNPDHNGESADAFHRNQGLIPLVAAFPNPALKEFYEEVLACAEGQTSGDAHNMLGDTRKRIVHYWDHKADKTKGKAQEFIEAAQSAFLENLPKAKLTAPIVQALTTCANAKMPEKLRQVRATHKLKEYDSYVAHRMFQRYASIKAKVKWHKAMRVRGLNADTHAAFLDVCLEYIVNGKKPSKPHLAYLRALRKGVWGRKMNVLVLHDLGLDPQSDDWLAIVVLTTVKYLR